QAQIAEGAEFILARVRAPKERDGAALGFATGVMDQHALHKDAYAIPVVLAGNADSGSLFAGSSEAGVRPNLSERALAYAKAVGFDDDTKASRAVWMHALAIGYCPAYLRANAHGIASGWPRIPLPASAAGLSASSNLGTAIARLLNADSVLREQGIRGLGFPAASDGGGLSESDLGLTAQWGLRQREGVITPSKGKLTERDYTAEELAAIAEGAESLGMTRDEAVALLGGTCFDVWLNDVAYWRCVPANVWRYTIGGYQVIKKWLSYRERALLGRDLKPEEARYVGEMVRRIAALVLMQPELDANYERVKADVWEWGG
ncbi:MAG: type ISP restriction/modification enzyme, partial [Coriobacteriia bacterium]|nr:type ISP restriction/modification enzyme [Coriobacteriia bacterium]